MTEALPGQYCETPTNCENCIFKVPTLMTFKRELNSASSCPSTVVNELTPPLPSVCKLKKHASREEKKLTFLSDFPPFQLFVPFLVSIFCIPRSLWFHICFKTYLTIKAEKGMRFFVLKLHTSCVHRYSLHFKVLLQ